MPTATLRKASRLTRDPVLDKDGSEIVVRSRDLTERDIQWFLILHEHYANVEYLAALTGCTAEWIRRRMRILKRGSNGWVDLSDEERQNPKAYRNDSQYFPLPEHSCTELQERAILLPPAHPRSNSTTQP